MTRSLIVLLALPSLVSCASAPQRIAKPVEAWFVDTEYGELYRKVSPVTEDHMPVKGNKLIDGWMCFAPEDITELMLRDENQ